MTNHIKPGEMSAETGISWYVGKDGVPYMLEEDIEKLIGLCKETGEDWSKKAAELPVKCGYGF